MKYRKKYIRALCFMFAFLVTAVFFYSQSREKLSEAQALVLTEQIRGAAGFATAIEQIAKGEKTELNAALAKEYLGMSGSSGVKALSAYALMNSIVEGKYGEKEIYAVAELDKRLKLLNYANDEIDSFYSIIYTCRYSPDFAVVESKSSIDSGRTGDITGAKSIVENVLGKSIKHTFYSVGDGIYIAYSSNRYMRLDTKSSSLIFFVYDCTSDKTAVTQKEAESKAVSFSLRALSQTITGAGLPKVKKAEIENNNYSFTLFYPSHTDSPVFISVRSDTGSVVYFDADSLIN